MIDKLEAKLDYIRETAKSAGCFSWTSRQYQDDIIQYLIEHRNIGYGVIEVGSYKGGLTALLAAICREYEWPLYSIDIDENAITTTRMLLTQVELVNHVTLWHGSLSAFATAVSLKDRPALIILDGDHRYEAVIQDIQSVYDLDKLPHAAVFHDYSLRHPTSGEKVDQAVTDSFGLWPVRNIGARMDGNGPYPTFEKPSEDGHWWEVPGSEGAIIELPLTLKSKEITKLKTDENETFLKSFFSRFKR